MEVTAKIRNYRMSPRKVRLVADAIRGQDVAKAETTLTFMEKKASGPMLKLVRSAIANATNGFGLQRDNLFIKTITVDGAPVLKRWTPKAFGRATPILRRGSHITITLGERVATTPTTKKALDAAATTVVTVDDLDQKATVKTTVDSKKNSKKNAASIKPQAAGAAGRAKTVINRKSS